MSKDPTTAVAFHTRLSTELTNPGDDQTIIMSDVLTNAGGAYDSSTGYFTCPESGVYVFFVTTLAFPNKHIETMLLKNGHRIGMLISGNSDTWGPSSNMVIVTAQKGDHVWVKVNDHYHDTGTVLHQGFTTFSGFLLH
ncbi:Complement C1q tumor necrosis factor-related protein 3 [Mizuhopecten yessoensis]|uniref:Complement C1q tumor necrosis factor-related protein 3 n=1 Tax=Mizuhopecten yessoensis TaxID=6573 RepID=A0A210PDC8_MIZYE|nr:Complement C1q tumor necrosis factor-related protein 3 [Mizuhopecten yessoensis]